LRYAGKFALLSRKEETGWTKNGGRIGPFDGQRKKRGLCEQRWVSPYAWIVIALGALIALAVVMYYVLIFGWALMLRRMAGSGIRSWDELESEDAELRPRF
jgi:SNF family Na+-dependent transporter